MRLVCCYCTEPMGVKEPLEDARLSHGICDACLEHFEGRWEGLTLGEYLDRFHQPVLVLDRERQLITMNVVASRLTGKSPRKAQGLLGGEVLECVYARRSGGCGRAIHCQACTIRRLVTATLEIGQPQGPALASLEQDTGQQLGLVLSTLPQRQGLLLFIEQIIELPKG